MLLHTFKIPPNRSNGFDVLHFDVLCWRVRGLSKKKKIKIKKNERPSQRQTNEGVEETRTHLHFFKTTRNIMLLRGVRRKFSRPVDLYGDVGPLLDESRKYQICQFNTSWNGSCIYVLNVPAFRQKLWYPCPCSEMTTPTIGSSFGRWVLLIESWCTLLCMRITSRDEWSVASVDEVEKEKEREEKTYDGR